MAEEECLRGEPDAENGRQEHAASYGLETNDSPLLMFLYGIQVMIFHVMHPVTACFLIYNSLCTGPGDEGLLARLISASIFISGFTTMLQVLFGLRLPVFQGSCYTFIPVVTAMMTTQQWKCPTERLIWQSNGTTVLPSNSSIEEQLWRPRLLEINGALAMASCVQVFIGCTGLISSIMSKIGPLTVAPTICLVGLSLLQDIARLSGHHWGLALLTVAIFLTVSVVLEPYKVTLPWWNSVRGFHTTKANIFSRFTSLYYILVPWALCWILTLSNALPSDPKSNHFNMRADIKLDIVKNADWLFIPYPGYFGKMTLSLGIFLGMTTATFSSIIESVGDYYATANFLDIPTPPRHAVNRAILVEGVGGVLCASLGICHSTTSISANASFVAITKVYSRRTWLVASFVVMLAGLCGKFGAAFAIVPDAIVGGSNLCVLGVLPGFACRVLRHCDISSVRNMSIYGLSLSMGMAVPYYVKDNPNAISTGVDELDQALTLFLSSGIILGGVTGFILDNIIPGSLVERGVADYQSQMKKAEYDSNDTKVYDLPWGSAWMRRYHFFSYIPFLPTYKPKLFNCFHQFRRSCNGNAK